jgi:hypothetical protein
MRSPAPRVSGFEFWVIVALAVLVAAVLLGTRRQGHDWGGDFSLYISHARNLADGRPYAATGYLPNPYFRSHSPSTYPPLFPLILAPLYARWGLNYNVLKIPGIVCFALSIPVLFLTFRRDLPASRAFVATLLWTGWPFILEFKDSVLPDLVFTLLFAIALWLLRDTYDRLPSGDVELWRAALIGLVLYAVYATRSIGIVLPAAVGAYDLLRYRRVRRFVVIALSIFALLTSLQNLMVHNEGSYYQMFSVKLVENAQLYAYCLSILFSSANSGWPAVLRYLLATAIVPLAVMGFFLSLRRFRSPTDFAFALYAAILLLWNAGAGTRYMVPVMPLVFFYAMVGLDLVPISPRAAAAIAGTVAILASIAYISQYRSFKPGPIADGVLTPGFADLCTYVETHTLPDDRFIFENPRVLSLYTRRPAGVYPLHGPADLTWEYRRRINARYIVDTDILEPDTRTLAPFMERYSAYLHPVYINPHFRVFAVEP